MTLIMKVDQLLHLQRELALSKAKSLNTKLLKDKDRAYELYDKIFDILNGDGTNSFCRSLYKKNMCSSCCVFLETETHKDGKPAHTFIGMLPFEREYLEQKGVRNSKLSELAYKDKFVEHPMNLGIICKKSEATCIMKPVDCAMHPYSFANYSQKKDGTVLIDIIVAKHKCSIFSCPKLSHKFIEMTFHKIVDVAEAVCSFEPQLIELWSLFAPFYRGYEVIDTIRIPSDPLGFLDKGILNKIRR